MAAPAVAAPARPHPPPPVRRSGHARRQRPAARRRSRDHVWTSGQAGMAWDEMIQRTCREHGGFEPDIRHRTNDANVSLALVDSGLAVTLLPAARDPARLHHPRRAASAARSSPSPAPPTPPARRPARCSPRCEASGATSGASAPARTCSASSASTGAGWGTGFPYDVLEARRAASASTSPCTLFAGDNGTRQVDADRGLRASRSASTSSGGELERARRAARDRRADPGPSTTSCEPVLARWARPRTGYFLRAESFFNVAAMVDQQGDVLARPLALRRRPAARAVARRVVPRARRQPLRRRGPLHPRRAGGRALGQRQPRAAGRDRARGRGAARSSSSPPTRRSCSPSRARRSTSSTRTASPRSPTTTSTPSG